MDLQQLPPSSAKGAATPNIMALLLSKEKEISLLFQINKSIFFLQHVQYTLCNTHFVHKLTYLRAEVGQMKTKCLGSHLVQTIAIGCQTFQSVPDLLAQNQPLDYFQHWWSWPCIINLLLLTTFPDYIARKFSRNGKILGNSIHSLTFQISRSKKY